METSLENVPPFSLTQATLHLGGTALSTCLASGFSFAQAFPLTNPHRTDPDLVWTWDRLRESHPPRGAALWCFSIPLYPLSYPVSNSLPCHTLYCIFPLKVIGSVSISWQDSDWVPASSVKTLNCSRKFKTLIHSIKGTRVVYFPLTHLVSSHRVGKTGWARWLPDINVVSSICSVVFHTGSRTRWQTTKCPQEGDHKNDTS